MDGGIPWGDLIAAFGVNGVLAGVVYKLWTENRDLQKELRDTHKKQADFWREMAQNMEVKE